MGRNATCPDEWEWIITTHNRFVAIGVIPFCRLRYAKNDESAHVIAVTAGRVRIRADFISILRLLVGQNE